MGINTKRLKGGIKMKKQKKLKKPVKKFTNFVLWLVGILVALAVGFGLTSKVLVIPWIPSIVTVVAGWIVIVTTIIAVFSAIISYFN